MKALLNSLAAAIVVFGLGVHAPALAGPPRSPYGGIMHHTYSSIRQKQQQQSASYRYRTFANHVGLGSHSESKPA